MAKANLKKIITFVLLAAVVMSCGIFALAVSAKDETVDDPTLEIVANNVSYSDSLYILYAVKSSGFDYSKYKVKMLFWNSLQDEYLLGSEDYSAKSSGKSSINGNTVHVYYSDGIAAKEMTDNVYARACVEIDGNVYYSDVIKFSVLEYVYLMKEQKSLTPNQEQLFDNMLDYGTSAQYTFNHNTDTPANGAYHKISVTGGTLPDGFTEGRYKKGSTVIITADDPAPGMRFAYWTDHKGIIVSYDREFAVTAGPGHKKYVAVYRDISSVVAQLALKADIPYDGDVDDIDLPTAVSFEINGETVVLDVTWDTSSFVSSTIGQQTLYASLVDESAYLTYGIEPGSIVMEATTLPFTYAIDAETGNYILTGYYGSDAKVTIPTSYRNTPITTIATKAFNNSKTLTEVVITNTVTKIENGAFFYCDSIEKITIPFVGESATSSNSFFGWIFGAKSYDVQHGLLPLALRSVTLAEEASAIPEYAFYNCSQIEEFNLPKDITSMGYDAFYACSLTEFTVPESLTYFSSAFYNCYNLKRINVTSVDMLFKIVFGSASSDLGASIFAHGADLYCNGELVTELVVPAGTKEIEYGLFNGCSSIKKVYIPASVKCKLSYVFANMASLETVIFEEGSEITELDYTFSESSKLKSVNIEVLTNLKKINVLFSGASSLSEIVLPEGIEDIGNFSFSRTAIKTIILPENIQKIGSGTFSGCDALERIVIPASVVEIGDAAFSGCKSLSVIDLPAGLTTIGSRAFYECDSLTSIIIPARVSGIGANAFCYCDNLSQVTILTNRLTTIESYTFFGCTSLTNIEIPDSVTSIGSYAFYNCKSFKSIAIPDSVTSIGSSAFSHCTSLTSIEIPDSVTSIGDYAFENCTSLTSINYRGTESQWNAISKGEYWDSYTGEYTITYNYKGE